MKKAIVIIFCTMLAASCGACSFIEGGLKPSAEEAAPSPLPRSTPIQISEDTHAGVRFDDMVYERPDTEALRASIEQLEKDIADGMEAAALVDSYKAIYERFNAAESGMSHAYLLYAFDVTDAYYEDEYAFLQSELNAIDLMMTNVSILLAESSEEAEQLLRTSFGADYLATVYEEESLNSEAIHPLQDAALALENEYNRMSNEFSFTDEGITYTLSDVLDMADDESFGQLFDKYVDALNAAVGEIYLKMVAVRAEIASTLGYGSYAAYMYDCYGRDYTLQDAKTLHAAVKTSIVPVYLAAYGIETAQAYAPGTQDAEKETGFFNKALERIRAIKDIIAYFVAGKEDADIGAISLGLEKYPLEPFLTELQSAAADFSPNLYASLRYMLQNELYDFSVNPNKMAGSFTTYISAYDAPFIFSQWENDSYSVNTVIHELGHYTNYYRNPSVGWSAGDSLDLAEVDSQGLELLMIPYYDRFFGELAPYAERELLLDCMYALLSGCLEDEFQQEVYAHPGMTLDELNALYGRLASEYGFDLLFGYTGKEWAEIPHTFQSPMYYISYAVSMVPALELWRLSQTDMDAAKTAYFRIVDRAPYATFGAIIEENGLQDVFMENTLSEIAALLSERVN